MSTRAQRADPQSEKSRCWRDEQLLKHLPHIRCLAQRFSSKLPSSVEVGDLISDGILGLIDAAERFDPSRGVRFKTYAELRIRGAMLDGLRDLDWMPRSVRRMSRSVALAARALEQRLGHLPGEVAVADELGITLEEYRKMAVKLRIEQVKSLEEAVGDGTSHQGERADPDPAWRQAGPFCYVRCQELRKIFTEAIERLPKRERLVIALYYYDGLTMREVGAILGFRESRASHYHSRAKSQLLAHFRRLHLHRDCL